MPKRSPKQMTMLHQGSVSAICVTLICVTLASSVQAQEAAVVVVQEGLVDAGLASRIETLVSSRRSVLPFKSLPAAGRSPEEVANEARIKAIALALDRARKHEEVAAWNDCVKEAGDKLGQATEVLATSGRLELLRDLHVQIGSCMSLAGQTEDALTHFRTATLLDESPPVKGLHREEAEQAHASARAEVTARARGAVAIESDPPGAEVWIDGRRVPGVTPLSVDARLGQHFVTLRRFRHESRTTQAHLQPTSKVRFVLAAATRATLRQQLGEVRAGTRTASDRELDLANALWAGAGQLIRLSKPPGPSVAIRVSLVDATSGQEVRAQTLPTAVDDDELRKGVCGVLGDTCPEEGVNVHLIWPFAVAAAIGTAIAIGFILDSQRDTVFCPVGGC